MLNEQSVMSIPIHVRAKIHSGGVLLLSYRRGFNGEQGLEVNRVGAEMFFLCDGASAISKIALVIAERHRVRYDTVLADVIVLFEELERREWLVLARPVVIRTP